MDYEFHEISAIHPDMSKKEFKELCADIKTNGLNRPIDIYEGKILDGRHRYKACKTVGIVPKYREWSGSNPIQYSVSENSIRRHMTASQRSMVAGRIATMKQGGDRAKGSNDTFAPSISVEKAAKMLNVSTASVKRARAVLGSGDTDLIKSVDSGEESVSAASVKAGFSGERETGKNKGSRKTIRTKNRDEVYKPESEKQIQNANGQKKRMGKAISQIQGCCRGLEDIDIMMAVSVIDQEEMKEWVKLLKECSSSLLAFRQNLIKGGEKNGA